jgi:hypothetical protein
MKGTFSNSISVSRVIQELVYFTSDTISISSWLAHSLADRKNSVLAKKRKHKNKRMAEWKRNQIHERDKKTYDIPQRPVSQVSDTSASHEMVRQVDRLSIKYLRDTMWKFKRVTINAAGYSLLFFSKPVLACNFLVCYKPHNYK